MFRRTYIVKPALQFKYFLYGLAIVLLTGACAYFTMDLSVIHSEKLSQLSQGELRSVESVMRTSLFWMLGLLIILETVVGLFLFHRIIGPLYAVEKVLRMMADGDLTVYMPLRRGDELTEIAEAMEQMVGGIRRRILNDKEIVLSCQNQLNNLAESNPPIKNDLDKIRTELNHIGKDFRLG